MRGPVADKAEIARREKKDFSPPPTLKPGQKTGKNYQRLGAAIVIVE
jgi:hypothetical protein